LPRTGKRFAERLLSGREKQPQGLKPGLITNALRGAEAPLFHGDAKGISVVTAACGRI
jgi:hypothetical protein